MRRAVLYAAACIVIAVHPTYIATALLEGNTEISAGLDWIRTWALEVAESDTDRECYMVRKLGASKKCLESLVFLLLPSGSTRPPAKFFCSILSDPEYTSKASFFCSDLVVNHHRWL